MAFVEMVLFEKNNLISFRWKTRTLLTAAIFSNYNCSFVLILSWISWEVKQLSLAGIRLLQDTVQSTYIMSSQSVSTAAGLWAMPDYWSGDYDLYRAVRRGTMPYTWCGHLLIVDGWKTRVCVCDTGLHYSVCRYSACAEFAIIQVVCLVFLESLSAASGQPRLGVFSSTNALLPGQ